MFPGRAALLRNRRAPACVRLGAVKCEWCIRYVACKYACMRACRGFRLWVSACGLVSVCDRGAGTRVRACRGRVGCTSCAVSVRGCDVRAFVGGAVKAPTPPSCSPSTGAQFRSSRLEQTEAGSNPVHRFACAPTGQHDIQPKMQALVLPSRRYKRTAACTGRQGHMPRLHPLGYRAGRPHPTTPTRPLTVPQGR